MTNNFTNVNGTGNTASCDVVATTGNPDPASSQFTWRVRGTANNGWALAAPQYTQGAQFNVSTVGFSNIVLSFDWFSTTQGIKNLQVQYNTDVNNAAGWTNFAGVFGGNVATVKDASNNTQLVAFANGYNTQAVGTNVTSNTINFVTNAIAGVANNANFGVRLVSAFDPATGNYGGASGGTYNDSSGNWRFDQIAVRGVAIAASTPDAPSLFLFAVGGLGAVLARRRTMR